MKSIPYGRHQITEADIEAVVDVLRSDALTQGPKVAEFETAFAAYVGADHAVAISNGTAALHLSVLALGLRPGQKVITTPITFAATANCVRFAGAEVLFADIDPKTHLLDLQQAKRILRQHPRGTIAGIIPVDFAGRAVDLEAFRQLANEHGLWIIEDACHAPGGYFRDSNQQIQRCGNGAFADLSIFSFHPVKHIAAGEGGMITTNNPTLAATCRQLRCHGIQQDLAKCTQIDGGWYYQMQQLGYNYRLTDIQAALGISQLKRANTCLQRRRELAAQYNQAFASKTFIQQQPLDIEEHAFHLYTALFERRDDLYAHLHAHGIRAQVHYIPLHLMPYYRQRGTAEGDCPVAENYYKRTLSLPLFPHLTDKDQQIVIQSVMDFYANA